MNEDIETLTRAAAMAYATGRASRVDLILCVQAGDRLGNALQTLVKRVKELEAKYEPKAAESPGDPQPEPGNGEPAA